MGLELLGCMFTSYHKKEFSYTIKKQSYNKKLLIYGEFFDTITREKEKCEAHPEFL